MYGLVADPIQGRLEPGERVLWSGVPDRRVFTLGGSVPGLAFQFAFSVMWAGFAFFWEAAVIVGNAPLLFKLWGIPFVLIGLYMVAGRFVVARREATRTRYVITDRRVMLLTGGFSQRYTELDLRNLPPPQLDERADGIGTITFGQVYTGGRVFGPSWQTSRSAPAFVAVPDARRAFRVLTEARAEASQGTP